VGLPHESSLRPDARFWPMAVVGLQALTNCNQPISTVLWMSVMQRLMSFKTAERVNVVLSGKFLPYKQY
jgi:hypothetical protein